MQIESPTVLNTVFRLTLAGHACPQFLDDSEGVREIARHTGATEGQVLDYIRSLIKDLDDIRMSRALEVVGKADHQRLKRESFA